MDQEANQPFGQDEQPADRSKRNAIFMHVRCLREDGTETIVKVRNASATGLRGDCDDVADFGEGEAVRLQFRNLAPIKANVVWCEDGQVGLTFGKTIDIERVVKTHSKLVAPNPSPRSEQVGSWINRTENDRAVELARLAASGKRSV
jgi:hypothetical protein